MSRSDQPWNSVVIPARVRERAFTRWVVRPDGCWISTYSVASHGYAQIGWQGKTEGRHVVLAHRAAWEHLNGAVPLGMTLDHTCKRRRCVNTEHLRLLTNFENARRTNGQDWELGTCRNGHPPEALRPDQHRRTKDGRRRTGLRCAECMKTSQARYAWRQRHPGEPLPERLLLAAEREALAA